MNHTLTTGALLSGLLLAACGTTPTPPPALVDARTTVHRAETDPAVLKHAPLELKKATDSLARADMLLAKGEKLGDVNSVAYVAAQQAKAAQAIAQAKGNELDIGAANVERERARGDARTAEADKAKAQTGVAQQQAAAAQKQTAVAEQKVAVAQASAADAQQQTADLQQRLKDLQAQQTERGMLVTLGDVLFENNRADVKPGAQASLRKLADFLQQYPTRHVLIEGHTDSVGSTSSNESLSLRRADAVDAALGRMGVSTQRMDTAGYGEAYPVADNATDTNRALNRRVEVYIAENDQPVKARR